MITTTGGQIKVLPNENATAVCSRHVLGCVRAEADIMMSVMHSNDQFIDVFFTETQARELIQQLEDGLRENTKSNRYPR